MTYSEMYLYSPLSPKTVHEEPYRSLLLQFILSEIFHANASQHADDPLKFVFSSPACFFPYDWSREVGCLNKIQEHARLLSHAFPTLQEAIAQFDAHLYSMLKEVISCRQCGEDLSPDTLKEDLSLLSHYLEPFLTVCRENENLLLFLLKNADELQELCGPCSLSTLLRQMYPEGLEQVAHILRKGYQSRQFDILLPEIDQLISTYVK